MGCLEVFIDWGNDFSYAGTGSDVSERVITEVGLTFARGKDQIRAFAPPIAGDCRFALRNQSRDYSPGNMSSPIYGQVKPGKRVRVKSTEGAADPFLFEEGDSIEFEEGDAFEDEGTSARALWTGIADDFKQHPDFGVQAVEVPSFGMLSRLRGKNVTTPLYQNIRTDEALGYLLDAAGWPVADRVLQTGNHTIDWWWGDGDAFTEAISIFNSEGPGASLYEDAEGNIVFENNTARETQTRSVVSQATFEDTVSTTELEYFDNFQNVILACRIVQQEREAQPLAAIWTQGGDITFTAGEIKKFIVRGADPFLNAQVPTPFGTNEIQLVSPIVPLTSGQSFWTFKGQETGAIAYNATAADAQAELEALSSIGAGNVACGGGPLNLAPISVMFTGSLAEAEQELITVRSELNSASSLTTLDVVRTDDGAGTYTDTLIPRNTPITSGSFKLKQGSTTTPSILHTATAANIQTAWENTSQYDPGDLSASGGPIASAQVVINYTDGLTFPPAPTTVVDSTLMASRYTDALKVERSVKGSGPDYVVVSGGVSMSLDRDNGGSAQLTVEDDGAGSVLTGLQVRAQAVSVVRSYEVVYPESPADSEGRLFSPDVLSEIPLATAQIIAQSFYDRYHEPRPAAIVRNTQWVQAIEVEAFFEREISDLITIIDTQIGINETYFIEYIRFSQSGQYLTTEFGCEKAV